MKDMMNATYPPSPSTSQGTPPPEASAKDSPVLGAQNPLSPVLEGSVSSQTTGSIPASASAGGAVRRKPARRANTAERRATHNAVERQRRETLNGRFLDLAGLVPNLAAVRRPSKSAIVNSCIAFVYNDRRARYLASVELRKLIAESAALRAEVNEWRGAFPASALSNKYGHALDTEPVRSPDLVSMLDVEDPGEEVMSMNAEERIAFEMRGGNTAMNMMVLGPNGVMVPASSQPGLMDDDDLMFGGDDDLLSPIAVPPLQSHHQQQQQQQQQLMFNGGLNVTAEQMQQHAPNAGGVGITYEAMLQHQAQIAAMAFATQQHQLQQQQQQQQTNPLAQFGFPMHQFLQQQQQTNNAATTQQQQMFLAQQLQQLNSSILNGQAFNPTSTNLMGGAAGASANETASSTTPGFFAPSFDQIAAVAAQPASSAANGSANTWAQLLNGPSGISLGPFGMATPPGSSQGRQQLEALEKQQQQHNQGFLAQFQRTFDGQQQQQQQQQQQGGSPTPSNGNHSSSTAAVVEAPSSSTEAKINTEQTPSLRMNTDLSTSSAASSGADSPTTVSSVASSLPTPHSMFHAAPVPHQMFTSNEHVFHGHHHHHQQQQQHYQHQHHGYGHGHGHMSLSLAGLDGGMGPSGPMTSASLPITSPLAHLNMTSPGLGPHDGTPTGNGGTDVFAMSYGSAPNMGGAWDTIQQKKGSGSPRGTSPSSVAVPVPTGSGGGGGGGGGGMNTNYAMMSMFI